MSWMDVLLDNRALRAVFGEVDPSVDDVDIHEVRLERDGGSLFLRLDLAEFPAVPPKKWVAQEANTVQIELELSSIHSLSIEGWGTERGARLGIQRNSNGLIELTCRNVPTITATGEWLSLRMMRAHKSLAR